MNTILKTLKYMFILNKKMTDEEIKTQYDLLFRKNTRIGTLKKEVELINVKKVYSNGIKAIDNLTIKINPGEFVVLLGPSGCGKSTLLRMIAGLENVSDGYIKFNGSIINATSPKDREIAMVFQNYALYPFMTVFQNISFGLKNKRYSNSTYKEIKREIKIEKDSNFEEAEEIKIKIKILKDINPVFQDEKHRNLRLIKIAKINNKKYDSYSAKIVELDNKIQQHKLNIKMIKVLRKYNNLKNELKKENISDSQKDKLKSEISKINDIIKITKFDKEKAIKILELEKSLRILKENSKKNPVNKDGIDTLIRKKVLAAKIWNDYIPQKVNEVTSLLNIRLYSKRKPADLSGGQRQRVALARAISKQSGLFLYDEPLSNLDAKLRAKMRTEIRSIHNYLGATSVYVTHDQIEAMSMADKIVVMKDGYIMQIGTPLQLLESPNNLFVAKFIGNTDVNIINVKYISGTIFKTDKLGKIVISKQSSEYDKKELNSKIVMGIRPEHIITDRWIVQNFKKNKFKGKIISKELLGNDVLLTVESKPIGTIRMISNISLNHKIDDQIDFVIDPLKIHIYNYDTGFNLLIKLDKQNQNCKDVWLNGIEERRKNIKLLNIEANKLSFSEKFRLYMLSIFSKNAREIIKERKRDIEYGNQTKAD